MEISKTIKARSREMNHLIEVVSLPGLENSRAARIGRRLVALALAMKALNGVVAAALMLVLCVASVPAQTPTGSFFNRNSSKLGNKLRSVTFFLAAAMIIT